MFRIWPSARPISFIVAAFAPLVLIFLWTLPALADQVVTNDRVQTMLRVRAEANSTAEVLGFLKPGDRVPFVGTQGAWREIAFHSRSGFVASGYTTVVPDALGPTAAGASQSIRLGAWNLKKLGHGSNKDFAKVAAVIEQNFDILAIVEVMQKDGGHAGYESLINQLGGAWSGQITDIPRPATTSGSAEFYAIVWRSSALRPCSGWAGLRIFPDNDGSPTGTGEDHFSREPAFGCYEFGPAGVPVADFMLAAYHATFQSSAEINAEVGRLGNVFAAMQAARPGERDEIIVGDFNRTPPQIATLLPNFADRTTGAGSTLNSTGAVTANLYDHILVRDAAATTEMQGNAQVLDVRSVAGSPAAYFSTMSDHLPIVVTLQASGDDD